MEPGEEIEESTSLASQGEDLRPTSDERLGGETAIENADSLVEHEQENGKPVVGRSGSSDVKSEFWTTISPDCVQVTPQTLSSQQGGSEERCPEQRRDPAVPTTPFTALPPELASQSSLEPEIRAVEEQSQVPGEIALHAERGPRQGGTYATTSDLNEMERRFQQQFKDLRAETQQQQSEAKDREDGLQKRIEHLEAEILKLHKEKKVLISKLMEKNAELKAQREQQMEELKQEKDKNAELEVQREQQKEELKQEQDKNAELKEELKQKKDKKANQERERRRQRNMFARDLMEVVQEWKDKVAQKEAEIRAREEEVQRLTAERDQLKERPENQTADSNEVVQQVQDVIKDILEEEKIQQLKARTNKVQLDLSSLTFKQYEALKKKQNVSATSLWTLEQEAQANSPPPPYDDRMAPAAHSVEAEASVLTDGPGQVPSVQGPVFHGQPPVGNRLPNLTGAPESDQSSNDREESPSNPTGNRRPHESDHENLFD